MGHGIIITKSRGWPSAKKRRRLKEEPVVTEVWATGSADCKPKGSPAIPTGVAGGRVDDAFENGGPPAWWDPNPDAGENQEGKKLSIPQSSLSPDSVSCYQPGR